MFNQDKSKSELERQVRTVIADRFPLERRVGKGEDQHVYVVSVSGLQFDYPDTSFQSQAQAFAEDETLEGVVKADIQVTKDGKPFHQSKGVTLSVFPVPTERGTYIINGNEKVFLHQMLRRPGIYALPTKVESGTKTKEKVIGEVNTNRARYRLEVDRKEGRLLATNLKFEYGTPGSSTVDGISFLRMIGASDAEIAAACGNDDIGKEIYQTFMENAKPMSVKQIHEKTHVRPYVSDEETVDRIASLMEGQTFSEKSQRVNEISTGRKIDKVGKDAFLGALKAMVREINPTEEIPPLDDPRFKTILVPEAVIARSIDKGIGDWMNKMNTSLFRASSFGEAGKEKQAFRPATSVTQSVRNLYNGQLSEAVDSGNPLDLHQKLRKVTSLGDFGLSANSVSLSNRNLYPGMFAKVDPVETPQSGSMGIVEYLARDAEVKDGLVYSKFYRVKNRKVDTSKVVDDIDPLEEEKEYIAFNDPDSYIKDGKGWTLREGKVRVRHDNRFLEVDSKQVTLIDRSPASHLSYATGLIPFASSNDGARLLMGASMQKQALPVVGAEAPIVQANAQIDGRTVEQELADNVSHNLKAPVSGTVKAINDRDIVLEKTDGTEVAIDKLNYFSTGKNTGYIHHKPVVSVGDKVKKDDLLADGWHSKNGEFALGKNTTIAYMPYEGLNFEDSVVVSESFAKKMASEEVKLIDHLVKPELIALNQTLVRNGTTYKVSGLLDRESKLTREQRKKLDARGIIKKGQEFLPGDVLVAAFADTSQIEDTAHRINAQKRFGAFAFKPFKASGYQKGKVIDVHVKSGEDGQRVTIKYIVEKPMEKGDKLSGRHGNKGTISAILPDAEMPRVGGPDGEPVELIFSPLAVPSRKNIGQLYEVHAGMLAKKTGRDKYVMNSFDRSEQKRLLDEMEKAGMPDGKFTLYNPKNQTNFESKVTVGPMYIMKLKHKVEGKVTRRSTDRVGKTVDYMTNMPKKISGSVDGERQSPQAIGGMEFWSLTSAGAVENIHEMTTLKSDGIDKARGRLDLYDAIASGRPLPKPVTPETVKNLQDYLYGAGIRMSPMKDGKETTLDDHFTSLMLSPNKAKEDAFKGLPEVYSSKLDRVTANIDQKDLKHALGKETGETTRNRKGEEIAKGGLYDTDIFGEDADQWGKITLAAPVANPIFLKSNNAYASLLYQKGFKNSEVKGLAEGKLFYVFDDGGIEGLEKGSLVKAKVIDDLMFQEEKRVDAATGGEALERLLKEVDLEKTYAAIHKDLAGTKKVEDKTALVNHARVVAHAIDRDFKPEDYLLRTLPVMPLKYRPAIKGQGNSVSHDDLTKLYQHVLEDNVRHGQAFSGWKKDVGKHDIDRHEDKTPIVHRDAIPDLVPHERIGDSAAALYKRVEDLVGTKSPEQSGVTRPGTKKTEEDLKGILDRLSSKKGFLREKMQKKSQDFSGRSVIVVDPTLDLDEVSLPEDMVKEMFEPHILKELGKLGYDNPADARKQIEAGNRHYRAAVMQVLKDNPVILNRAPSLHKHSMQAFNVTKVSWNDGGKTGERRSRAIGLNPVVTTPYNADFDGDSLLNSVFVRHSEVGIEKEAMYNGVKGEGDMPVTGDTKIRYRYGLINLKEFPRTTLKEAKANKEIYHVPDGVEILTVWNNEKKWLPVESFSIHKDLDMLQVKTNTSRTLQVSDDHSLVTIDEELNYVRAPAKIGMTLPRLRQPVRGEEYELIHELQLPDVDERTHKFMESIPLDFDSGYFFGAYIGDGWVNQSDVKANKNAIYLADANGNVIKKVQSVIDSYLEDQNIHLCSVDSPHKFHEKDSFCVKRTWYSSKFSTLLRNHIGSGAKNKKLPEFWVMTAATFRWGLLSGLIDTDGSVSKAAKKQQTNVNITTTSHQLAYGVVGLAHSLDMNASVTVTQTPAGEISYVVTFSQESILMMKRHIWLANEHKMNVLRMFELGKTGSRNKYTPKLSVERLSELRKVIGCPPIKNEKGELVVSESEIPTIKSRRSLYVILSRILKNDTAITQDTALRIIETVPNLFEEEFWAKWKAIVLNPEIEWELVTEIESIPFITEAYDLTVPPNFTMVTESGIVVYDTMSVHVPLSEAAKREARELLMPSKNLVNPTNNSMIMELKHEMQLGIFYSTRDRMPSGKQVRFDSFKELEEAYRDGQVHTYQPVLMNVRNIGSVRSTAGKHLFNLALVDARVPKEFIDYEQNVDMDAKKVRRLMEQILAHPKGGSMIVTRALNNLKRVGFKTATHSGMSIGIRDFDAISKIDKKQMLEQAKDDEAFKKKLKKDDPSLFKAVYQNPVTLHAKQLEAFEQAKSNFVLNELKQMVDSKGGKKSVLDRDNPVNIMMQSGARGNAGQFVNMAGIVGVGKDVENKATAPVNSSLMEGLRPDEFFVMSADSRKGIYDKSVATQDPGALTRQIWFANRHVVISEKKCSDRTGITLYLKADKNTPGSGDQDLRHLRGRVLLQQIKLPDGVIRPSEKPISMQDFERVQRAVKGNQMEQVSVRVRSPLTCKSTHGMCQLCYGARPGAVNNELVPIGEAVGSIAAQALGEPSQQAIMRTFHSGAGQSSTTNAFEQIRNVLELSSTAKPNTAVVATAAGTITKILRHPFTGTTVTVDGKDYRLGSLPINPELREGVRVDVADSLTDPRSTHINPRDILELKGEGAAQSYLIDTVSDAFRMGNIDDTDRRHLELTVGVMTDRAVVNEPGTTGLLPGQTVRKKFIEEQNRQIRKEVAYDAPLTYMNMQAVIGKRLAKDERSANGRRLIGKRGDRIDRPMFDALRQDGRRTVSITDATPSTFSAQLFGVQNDTKMADGKWLGNAAFRNSKSHLLMGAAVGSEDDLDDPLTAQMTGKKGNFGTHFRSFVDDVRDRFAGMF